MVEITTGRREGGKAGRREGGEAGGGGRSKNFGCSVQDLSVLLKESEACVRQILFSLPLVMILGYFAKPST